MHGLKKAHDPLSHMVSLTQLFQQNEDHIFIECDQTSRAFITALKQALTAYFEGAFFTKRFVRGESFILPPTLLAALFLKDSRYCIVTAPGMLSRDLFRETIPAYMLTRSEAPYKKLIVCLIICLLCPVVFVIIAPPRISKRHDQTTICLLGNRYCNREPRNRIMDNGLSSPPVNTSYSRHVAKDAAS